MAQIDVVANNNRWPDEILRLCKRDPLYSVPFRIFIILNSHGEVQSSSVPYINQIWFFPAILAYVCWKRMNGLITHGAPTLSGHVFCCSSGSAYRTESLFRLCDYFEYNGDETTMLTVSKAEEKFRAEYDSDSTSLVSFRECFSTVSPHQVVKNIPKLWGISEKIAQSLEVKSVRYRIIAFNFLVVEFIKYRSIENTISEVDSFHTFAPMPYQIRSISHEKIYAYQHGVESSKGTRASAIPRYAQIKYFVWGDLWTDRFRKKANSGSAIYPVGSPRHDALVDKRRTKTESGSIDVLFISGSHVLSQEGVNEAAYKDLVEMVVDICEQHGWEPVIKLHPIEGTERYEQWGYDEYITSETDIEALLLESEIAVTDLSSAYIESICLGTPIIVTQSSKTMDLEPSYEIEGLCFPNSLTEARGHISKLKGSHIPVEDIKQSELMNLIGSCERIHEKSIENDK